jgi:hypothetical protein
MLLEEVCIGDSRPRTIMVSCAAVMLQKRIKDISERSSTLQAIVTTERH